MASSIEPLPAPLLSGDNVLESVFFVPQPILRLLALSAFLTRSSPPYRGKGSNEKAQLQNLVYCAIVTIHVAYSGLAKVSK